MREPLPLKGRVALVTGVSRRAGIGYAIARRLAAYGASLFLHHYRPHDRDQDWGADDLGAVLSGVSDSLGADGARVTDAHAALHGVTVTLADQLADQGIRLNTVSGAGGHGLSDRGDVAYGRADVPFGRYGEPDDPARLIAWLVTDEARWVTGQVIDTEGGFGRWRPRGT